MKKCSDKCGCSQVVVEPLKYGEAKRLVRKLGIRTQQAYTGAYRSHKLPERLPSAPQRTYAKAWKGWGEFLSVPVKAV